MTARSFAHRPFAGAAWLLVAATTAVVLQTTARSVGAEKPGLPNIVFLLADETVKLAIASTIDFSGSYNLLQQRGAEPGAAHIPAAVKREVWSRDGGCCQWPVQSGGVCGSRVRVQFDHLVMRVEGGKPTSANLRLLCDRHNRLAARERLGDGIMNRYCRDPRQAELADVGRGGG